MCLRTPSGGTMAAGPNERGARAMTVRIGINGFGRIGRNYLRAARAMGADIDIVAINDLTSAETLAHLLRYDSTHGRFGSDIKVVESSILLDSGPITVLAEREPKA